MNANAIHLSPYNRVRKTLLKFSDLIDRLCDVASPQMPPKSLVFQYGGGSFQQVGLDFFRILLDHCGLTRSSRVLEMGCGVGRIAAPLQYYLDESGSYDGVDIMPEGIEFCRKQVTPAFPNFRFHLIDVRNSFYNPHGQTAAEDFRFPFADGSFDLIFSTSLMTHLPPAAAANYVAETARMLRPGGTCLHTFYVLDSFAETKMAYGQTGIRFDHRIDGFATSNPDYVEDAIAMPPGTVRRIFGDAGLEAKAYPGAWAGNLNPLSFQDVMIARKH